MNSVTSHGLLLQATGVALVAVLLQVNTLTYIHVVVTFN